MFGTGVSLRSRGLASGIRREIAARALYYTGILWYYLSLARGRREIVPRAIGCFERAVRIAPDFADCWAWLGRAYARNRDPRNARRSWLAAVDIDPGHPVAVGGLDRLTLPEARRLMAEGEVPAALDLLRANALPSAVTPEANRLLVWALVSMGRTDEGWDILKAMIGAGDDDVESYVRVGQGLRKEQRLDDAAGVFRAALVKDPSNRRARIFLARTIEKSDPDEAVALWNGLLDDGLVGAEARHALDRIAEVHRRSAEKERQATLKTQLKQKTSAVAPPARPKSRAKTGRPAVQTPDAVVAEDASVTHSVADAVQSAVSSEIRAAASRHAADEGFRHELDAVAFLDTPDAIDQAYLDLWRRHGDVPELLKKYAQFQLRRKNLSVAYQLLKKLTDDFANGPFAYRHMAGIQLAWNRPERAERLYLDAIVEFDDAPTITDYSRFLADQGRIDEGLANLKRLDWDDRHAPPAYRQFAQHLVRTGHLSEALRAFETAIDRFPQQTAFYRDQAKVLNELGRQAEAVVSLNRLVARKPDDLSSWAALIYILARAERHAEAEEAVARARRAVGRSPAGLGGLGRAAEKALMNDAAEALFAEAAAAFPHDSRAHAEFGGYFLRQGAICPAISCLSEAARLAPDNAQIAADLKYVRDAFAFLGYQADPGALGGEVLLPEALFPFVREIGLGRLRAYRPIVGRILVATSSLTAGGAERQAANTVTELINDRPGVKSVVLAAASLSRRRRRDFYLSRVEKLPVDIVSLEEMSVAEPLDHPDIQPFADLLGYFTIDIRADIARWIILILAERPEVVHTWQDYINIAAGVAAVLVGVPNVVLGTRNTRPDNKYRRLKRYMQTAYCELVTLPSVRLLNNSVAGARDYESWLGLPEGKVAVVWNGLNLAGLTEQARDQAEIRATLGIPEDAPVMGGVFRMSDEKRPMLWLDTAAIVAKSHPDAHFIMCGDGVLYNDARMYAERLGLAGRVHMPGMQANIGAWYRAMSIFLLASRKEGLPNVLIEAQAFGLPVVSSNVGGASEVIMPGQTGWAVDDSDAERLAERILWCLDRPEWIASCRDIAPSFVNATFSLDAMIQKTLTIYGVGGATPQ